MRPKSVFAFDGECLDALISIHVEVPEPIIVDVTYNKGNMWKKSGYSPYLTSDINTVFAPSVDVCASMYAMPFCRSSFDVLVLDPPHLPSVADSVNSSKIWRERYGLISDDFLRDGDNVSPIFYPMLMEAKRVLVDGGICIVKIADFVHNHRFQWQMVDLINTARKIDMTPCDLAIKTNNSSGNLSSSKWKNVYHLRRAHSYFVCIRNAGYDEKKFKIGTP
jgi:hypothetical protein